jgi:uncharacterized protein with NRDE domain
MHKSSAINRCREGEILVPSTGIYKFPTKEFPDSLFLIPLSQSVRKGVMCVLVLVTQPTKETSLMIGANRDEFRQRPSAAPAILEEGIMGGQDLEAGGTWLGVNQEGLFVAITNRSHPLPAQDSPSRGKLVMEALRTPTVQAAQARVEKLLNDHPYAGFNLVVLKEGTGFCFQNGEEQSILPITPGIHVVSSNRDMDDPRMQEKKVATKLLKGLEGEDAIETGLLSVLKDHEDKDGYPVCKHGNQYGTVSSTLLRLPVKGLQKARYLYTSGQPCTSPFEDYSSTIHSFE